jgi:tetratricopeptide (TPR) repeat protein
VLWQTLKDSGEIFIDQYAFNYPADIEIRYGEELRGNECSLNNLTRQECQKIEKGLEEYNLGNYKQSIIFLEDVLKPRKKNFEMVFFLANSYFYLEQFEKAKDEYIDLLNIDDYIYSDEVKYFLALSYIGLDEKNKAEILLTKIIKDNSPYSKDATIILSKI